MPTSLLVNPIRDGLNLVAKEGPLVNERDGVLVLSHQAGAWDELGEHAIGVNPFDVAGTAAALAAALDLPAAERAARARSLRKVVEPGHPWTGSTTACRARRPGRSALGLLDRSPVGRAPARGAG